MIGRRAVVIAGLLLAILVVAGWTRLATASSLPRTPAPVLSAAVTPSPSPSTEITRTDKVDLLSKLASPPGLLIMGSSRAMRVDPAYLQQITGLSGFNCAVSSGSIADAWSFVHLAHDLFPGSTQHYLWFMDIEQLRATRVHHAIFEIPQLAQYIPTPFWYSLTPTPTPSATPLAAGAARAVTTPTPTPTVPATPTPSPSPTYGDEAVFNPDGMEIWNMYDYWAPRGRTLQRGLAFTYWKFNKIYPNGFGGLRGVPKWFLEHTLALMNSWGQTPVIVLTPYHPSLLRFITARGFEKRHQDVLNYFQTLKAKYSFVLLDYTSIKSFGGWKSGFYDGVHPKVALSDQMALQAVMGSGGVLP